MADDNKNLAGDTERTSILPQSEPQVAEQTEVLPTHASQAETAQMPPVAQEQTNNAFAGTPLESVAGASADDQVGDEAVAASAATGVPASKKTSWGKRAAIAGAAAAVLSVGFGAGIITHAAVMGDGQDFYEQGYEDGYNDQGDGDEDGDFGPAVSSSRVTASSRVPVTASSRVPVMVSKARVMVSSRGRAPSRETLAALDRDLLRRVVVAPAANLEARGVRIPQPRMRIRPPAER